MRRKPLTEPERANAFWRIGGVCHVCGGELNYHDTASWVIDHVRPRKRGGLDKATNYLPACIECNGLRWSHSPTAIRRILLMGVIANFEGFKTNKKNGSEFRAMYARRLSANWLRRRMKKVQDSNERASIRTQAEAMIKGFVALDEEVMKRQRKTKSWDKALEQVLADSTTHPALKKAYLDLTTIGFNSKKW
jgi:hypothetical protein